jgi:hypothetical protein
VAKGALSKKTDSSTIPFHDYESSDEEDVVGKRFNSKPYTDNPSNKYMM